jgi:alpha-ketoglutarate-dependent taurine dioxygenase
VRIATKCDQFVAELVGDGESLVAQREIEAVRAALDTHAVVVLRDIVLSPAEQVALTKLLGEPEVVTDMRNHHPESLDVLVVSTSGATPVIGNLCWHSDRSFLPEPTRYTILRADVVPDREGDTLFADMVAAYAEAPVSWKRAMVGAKGVHTYDKTARLRARLHNKEIEEYESRYAPVRHPLVRRRPEADTPALFISELCLAGLEYDDGSPVPDLTPASLLSHATHDRFVYRHEWQQGDVLIWDNPRVLHKAASLIPGLPRVMHRTTTAGGVPQAATARLRPARAAS